MDGADAGGWSAVAEGWAELWGRFAEPAWTIVLDCVDLGPGARVLDVGCGSGDLLAHLAQRGFSAAGIDPAPGMVALARDRVPAADIRSGDAEDLPWPADLFDLVTAVNALQFADDTDHALAQLARVTVPGGAVAVVNWAESALNDLDTIEAALAKAMDEDPRPDGDLRMPGALEGVLATGGLEIVSSGLVEVPWNAPDDEILVRGVLLGEDPETVSELAPVVIEAAKGFRTPAGGYHLVNHFRYGVGRKPA
jgi:SAM-dependent methyltransferase